MGSGPSIAQPAPRDIGKETQATLQAELNMAPAEYAAYQKYAPQYAQTDVNTLGKSLFGQDYTGNLTDINTRLTDYANQQTTSSNSALRGANQADVEKYGPQMQQMLQQMNPDFYGQISRQGASANQGVGSNPYAQQLQGIAGSSAFNPITLNNVNAASGNQTLSAMQNQYLQNPGGMSANQQQADQIAQGLLAQGGNLTASETRNVEQASRGAYQARGLGGSNSSIVGEAMNTDAAKRARLVQNVGIAQGIEGQSQAQRQNAQQFGMNLSGQQMGYDQLGYNAQLANNQNVLAQQGANMDAANQQFGMFGQLGQEDMQRQLTNFGMGQQALGNYASANFDPYAAILGQSSINQGTNAGLFGQSSGMTGQSNQQVQGMFDPYNAYAQDLYNTNYNAQMSARNSTLNNAAAQRAAIIGAMGSLGGGAMAGF
jgi:hypothetical protein